jgi:hypothetical protein
MKDSCAGFRCCVTSPIPFALVLALPRWSVWGLTAVHPLSVRKSATVAAWAVVAVDAKRLTAVGHGPAFQPVPPRVRNGSRLCENSRVQFARRKFFSIWSICKPKLLTTAIGGGQKRNRFYALLAHTRFHAAWVDCGPSCIVRRSAAVGGEQSFGSDAKIEISTP